MHYLTIIGKVNKVLLDSDEKYTILLTSSQPLDVNQLNKRDFKVNFYNKQASVLSRFCKEGQHLAVFAEEANTVFGPEYKGFKFELIGTATDKVLKKEKEFDFN